MFHKTKNGVSGNEQRNEALKFLQDVSGKEYYILFLDDDTILHPDLWNNIKEEDSDFISFMQNDKQGNLRLKGDVVMLNYVDSGNFITALNVIGDLLWDIKRRDADGIFAHECFRRANSRKYIPKVLSIYNALT